MEQDDGGRVDGAGSAVEDIDAVGLDGSDLGDGLCSCHCAECSLCLGSGVGEERGPVISACCYVGFGYRVVFTSGLLVVARMGHVLGEDGHVLISLFRRAVTPFLNIIMLLSGQEGLGGHVIVLGKDTSILRPKFDRHANSKYLCGWQQWDDIV